MKDEYTMKLDYPEFDIPIWVNPKVFHAISKRAKQEVFDDVKKFIKENRNIVYCHYCNNTGSYRVVEKGKKDRIVDCNCEWIKELKDKHLSPIPVKAVSVETDNNESKAEKP